MPTENMQGILPRKIFFEDQDGDIKELCTYESKEENNDDAVDAIRYAVECMNEGIKCIAKGVKGITEGKTSITIELPKDKVRQILKLYGLERITRKRFKKLLMGCGMQRNDAEIVASAFRKSKIQYTSLAVQKVIETINIEVEKEHTQNEMSRNV